MSSLSPYFHFNYFDFWVEMAIRLRVRCFQPFYKNLDIADALEIHPGKSGGIKYLGRLLLMVGLKLFARKIGRGGDAADAVLSPCRRALSRAGG